MQLWFVDDARQQTPTRQGMGPLRAAGAICVSEANLKSFEDALDALCRTVGFPDRQEFKWSPGRELWMRDHLTGQARTEFFLTAVTIARDHDICGALAVVDTDHTVIAGAGNHETSVVRLLLERIQNATSMEEYALFIADTPSGGSRQNSDAFISDCPETMCTGTNALSPLNRIAMVLTCSSHLNRCLQFADLFTSCLTAFVSGENRWSPSVARELRGLLRAELGRVGGCGVKIHPDYVYANLYHWLFGDDTFVRSYCTHPMPILTRSYKTSVEAYCSAPAPRKKGS